MATSPDFCPNWVSSPGDTIADLLRERSLSDGDFARAIGSTVGEARSLLEGRTAITLDLARKLQGCLGSTVEFWMARDYQYRQDVARLNFADRDWLKDLPLGDMIRFGWLTPPHIQVRKWLRV